MDKLNGLVAGTAHEGKTLEEVVLATAGDAGRAGVFNNAAQIWNHTFYWKCMAPNGGGAPNDDLGAKIETEIGGLDTFKRDFSTAAANRFGSG